jgi:hypothetical protein
MYITFAAVAAAVGAIALGVVAATGNQETYVAEDAVPSAANLEGSFTSESGMVNLNKEKWHDDPFGDEAAKVRAQAGQ